MSGAKAVRQKNGKPVPQDEHAIGLWVDTDLIARLHGRKSSPLAQPTWNGNTERLLHYADVLLGTDRKEKFVSIKLKKERTK